MMKNISTSKKSWLSTLSLLSMFLVMMPTNTKLIAVYLPSVIAICFIVKTYVLHTSENYLDDHNNSSMNSPLCILLSSVYILILILGSYNGWAYSSKVAKLASYLNLNSETFLLIVFGILGFFGVYGLTTLLLNTMYSTGRIKKYVQLGITGFYTFAAAQIMMYVVILSPGPFKTLLGIVSIFFLTALCSLIIGKFNVALSFSSLIVMLFATVNNYVYRLRGTALKPLDLRSVNTALNVVGEYSMKPPLIMILCWFGWLLIVLWLSRSYKNAERIRCKSLAAIIVLSIVLVLGSKGIIAKGWGNEGSSTNGTVLNFILDARDSFVKKPDNYTSSNGPIAELKNDYAFNTSESEVKNTRPAIIVIMDESFTDYSSYRNEIKTDIDLIPFIRSLDTDVISGYAYSSVFGGNTANSEFEFLTGNTMAFLPAGSVAYQQYIFDKQYSILSPLHQLDYECIVTHPYLANGWNRPAVYESFGFDEATFYDDYPQKQYIRKYISDQEMFEYIVERYERRNLDKNFFLFGITMQNHGGYLEQDFESSVNLQYDQEFPKAEQFLSLTQLTDKAVEYLVNYFKQIDEPVVICFFGDHQPAVEPEFLEELNGGRFENINDEMEKYKIPFFVWANYDIEEQTGVFTSINYLSNYVLEAAGIELPAYNCFLEDLSEKIPVITSNGYYSKENDEYLPINKSTGAEKELLNKYNILEYNNMFDKKNLSDIFEVKVNKE